MSPQIKKFNKNSIIYFTGDTDSNIYILKEGQVVINYIPPDKLEEEAYLVKPGEFFGLKSAMGKYPREETAMAVSDVVAIVLNEAEFLAVNGKNEELLLKILKALSKELRDTVKKVNQLSGQSEVLPDVGLFNYGMYYFRIKQYKKAEYCFKRLLELYPGNFHKEEVLAQLKAIESFTGNGSNQEFNSISSIVSEDATDEVAKTTESSESAKPEGETLFYNGLDLVIAGKFEEAMKIFKQVYDNPDSTTIYKAKSLLEMAKCLKNLQNLDAGEKILKKFITEYQDSEQIKEALYELADVYRLKKDISGSIKLLEKIINIQPADETTTKAKRLFSTLKK